jgi:STE24 endopeptidase
VRIWLALRQARHVAYFRGAVPEAFAASIPLADHQKAADYTQAKLQLGRLELLFQASFLLLLTLGGGLNWLAHAWLPWFELGTISHGMALIASLGVVNWLLDLPFTLYRTFKLEARFGFNRTTWQVWLTDLAKETLLGLVLGLPILAAVLWLMAAMGAQWWLYVWLFWLGFNLLVLLIWPTWIAPLFNRFSPLQDEALKTRIEALLTRCGFRSQGLFVMDGSKRSAHGNAYFTGFGSGKRIVFFDTLLEKLSPAEIEAVLAHELGHFKHHHLWQRLLVLSGFSLLLLYGLAYLINQPWFFNGLGISFASTAMGLILFMLVLPVFTFPLAPLMSYWSRHHEYQADSYAASQTNANDLVTALVKLYRDNAATLTPDPLFSAWHDSHPPAALRIAHLQPCSAQEAS